MNATHKDKKIIAHQAAEERDQKKYKVPYTDDAGYLKQKGYWVIYKKGRVIAKGEAGKVNEWAIQDWVDFFNDVGFRKPSTGF